MSFQTRGRGLESRSEYLQTPHLYVVDSTDILLEPDWAKPSYIGESKKQKWLTGWVYFDILAEKYCEDPFIQQCLDPKLRRERLDKFEVKMDGDAMKRWEMTQTIVNFMMINRRKAVHVRIITPIIVKYRRKGWHFEPYVASL